MSKVIDISKYLDQAKPKVTWDNNEYIVNDTLETMIKIEETMSSMEDLDQIEKTLEIALGKAAVKEINVRKWSMSNFKILLAGIFAAIEGSEDIESILNRFQQ